MSQKTVAIVGRPNVGKSTLFNRLIGKREAIETPIAGTTRDCLYGDVFWRGRHFCLIDLAGVETGTKSEITKNTQEGVDLAIDKSDLILFVVDWTDKENELDRIIARKLRSTRKNAILVINKVDNIDRSQTVKEFERLGRFKIIPVSAISGKNTGDLLDEICEKLFSQMATGDRRPATDKPKKSRISLAILGRPNVGKSTLLNTIIGQKRAVVSTDPGTTRDTFSVNFSHKGFAIKISDTAGIRRRGKIVKDTIESFSVMRSLKALKEASVVVLVIDAVEGIVAGDTHLLGQAIELGKAVVLAVNKIDLWTEKKELAMSRVLALLGQKLNFAPWLPVVFISAEKSDQIKPLLNQVITAHQHRQSVVDPAELEQILELAIKSNPQLANIKSLRQKKSAPPIFELRYSGKRKLHPTQIRYLENRLRDQLPLAGTPVFIDLISK